MIAPLQNADCLFLSGENQAKVGYTALAVVDADKLISLSKDFLAAGYHLEDVSGLVTSDGAVSVYHFAHFDTPGRATVLVIAPLAAPSFPSIASVYQGAEWHERETRDFFGFAYEGNPNFIPLLLSEDMVDVHPLQKDEGALASLASIFSAPGREREIVKQADGFTLLDVPVAEEPAPAEAAPAPETPKAEEAPKPAPEAPKTEAAPKAETVPAQAPEAPEQETRKEAAEEAPAPEKKEEPAPAPKAEEAPKAEAPKPEVKPEPKPEPKPAPPKAEPKGEAKPAPKKVQGSVKKGKVVKSGKKGAGNA